MEWEMAITTLLDAYALFSPSGTPDTWLCNYPLLSSFMAKSIDFLQLQLPYDILGFQHMAHYAFPSALHFSTHWNLTHILWLCT
jgi:hypothetical protein